MKYNNTHFMQLSRCLYEEPYCNMSINAKWLFVTLNELEQRYTGTSEDFFFRSNEELARDCNITLKTLKKVKKELLSVEPPLVQSWQMHFVDPGTGKKSEKHITAYRILK